MDDGGKKKAPESTKKIKIGRLHVDPVFLVIFLFFTLSSFLMALFVWLAS